MVVLETLYEVGLSQTGGRKQGILSYSEEFVFGMPVMFVMRGCLRTEFIAWHCDFIQCQIMGTNPSKQPRDLGSNSVLASQRHGERYEL